MRDEEINAKQKVPYDKKTYILVVDDDLTMLKFLKIHLNKFFTHVLVAPNAFDAVEILKNQKVDIVISDINMPKMNGIDLMHHIIQNYPRILTLLISGASLSEFQLKDIEAADGYLRKPFPIDFLNKQVKTALKGQGKIIELESLLEEKRFLRKVISSELSLKECVKEKDKKTAEKVLKELLLVQKELKKTA
tara:strand:- start:2 stop:577 length:576 start_codon:yes stop_codon:yes gene_type:complete